jgi:ABC-type bacteriocin/lantibiotic exporter with double-glycine peptidase domain
MKLKVPFYKQTPLNCGPTALRMVFSYFGNDTDISVIENLVNKKDGKGVSTILLAIAAAELGFKTEFYSKSIYFNEDHLKKDYYKKHADITSHEQSKIIVNEARNKGIQLFEKSITLNEILQKITTNSLPIALLDWNIVKGKKGYNGHFVVIVGYDKDNVYVHNQSFRNPKPFMKIPIEFFEKARKADGTDEDLVIIKPNASLISKASK